jgi:hypothetical protein
MKKLAIILSILLIAGLNVEAQRRTSRSSEPKSYKKSNSGEKKSSKKSKSVAKISTRKSSSSKAKSVAPRTKRSNSRATAARSDNRSNARSTTSRSYGNAKSRSAVKQSSSRSSSRAVASRPDRRNNVSSSRQVKGRVANTKNVVRVDRRNVRVNRRPLSVVRAPRIGNIRIRHGYVDYSHRRYGYSSHYIMNFPMRVRYPFYQNHQLVLMHSYRPQVEYPWAIYESEGNDNTASIEGKVLDIDYNRRTNQYEIHFGRKSPYQSATVIIPDYLSQYIDHRSLRKLKRDYVSVYGMFTNYGNVPTIIINSLDEFFVEDVSLKDFLYYN